MSAHHFMRWCVMVIVLLALLPFAAGSEATVVQAAPARTELPSAPVHFYVHTATAANTVGAATYIDYPPLNGSSNLYVFVSQNWNPPGSAGVYNPSPVGVWYSSNSPSEPAFRYKWAIINQNGSAIPLGASFNVMYFYVDSNAFVHYMSPADLSRPYTILDNVAINNDPNAILIITYYEGMGGNYANYLLNTNLGLAYNTDTGRWWVVTEPNLILPRADDMILVFDVSGYEDHTFLHTTASNVYSNYTWFYDPASDYRPKSLVFATHYLGAYPPGTPWVYDSHPLGVWFDGYSLPQRWNIFNQDLTTMSQDMFFHIFIIPAEYIYLPAISR